MDNVLPDLFCRVALGNLSFRPGCDALDKPIHVIVIVGINFFALYNQLRLRDSRKEMLRNLVQGFDRSQMDEDSKKTR